MSLEASGAVAEASPTAGGGGGSGGTGGDLDRWIGIAKECKYLPENDLKVRLLDKTCSWMKCCETTRY